MPECRAIPCRMFAFFLIAFAFLSLSPSSSSSCLIAFDEWIYITVPSKASLHVSVSFVSGSTDVGLWDTAANYRWQCDLATKSGGGGGGSSAIIEKYSAGDLYAVDSILGNLRYIPGTGPTGFTQGSPSSEPCRQTDENPRFTHILTRSLAAMETEVSRQMWADLKAIYPVSYTHLTLPTN